VNLKSRRFGLFKAGALDIVNVSSDWYDTFKAKYSIGMYTFQLNIISIEERY
jgi:hypothetical protein